MANQRQIISDKNITSNKAYYDFLYGYIQIISGWEKDDTERKIAWKSLAYDTLALNLGNALNRKTIAKGMDFLKENSLIRKDGEYYYLDALSQDESTLIDYDTLEALVNCRKRHLIDLYCYLVNGMYYAKNILGERAYIVTMKNMKEQIGIATSTTSNNNVIKDLLDTLVELGLITYRIELDTKLLRRYYKITKVNGKIK